MASIPVSITPAVPAAPEAGSPAAGGTSPGNQRDGQAFSLLMKHAAHERRKPKAEELLLAMTAAAPAPQSPVANDALPVAGTMLPGLPPPPDGAAVQGAHDGSGPDVTGRGKQAQPVVAGSAAAKLIEQRGDDAKADAAATAAKGDDRAGRHGDADMPAQFLAPAAAHGAAAPDAQGAQMTLKDMSTLLGHHGAVEAPGAGDGTAANPVSSALLQSADKAPAAPVPGSAAIAVPLRHAEWADELGNRISWMVRQDVQSASVKLNPPHLGPLEIKVSMVNDQVNVSFTTHHAPVREALDASMPRLRDLLGDSGLQLGDANVTHRPPSDQRQFGQQSGGFAGGGSDHADGAGADEHLLAAVHEPLSYAGDGVVDLYA